MPAIRGARYASCAPHSIYSISSSSSDSPFSGSLSEILISDSSDSQDDDLKAFEASILTRKPQILGPLKKCLATKKPKDLVKKIIIKGITFKPTIIFDTFWRFAAERKAIDDRRRTGMPPPWSDDPILQEYSFCNTYRVLDKVSQYLIKEVIEKGSQDPQEVIFRVVLFNTFTKIGTWERLVNELGPLTWKRYRREDYQRVLKETRDEGITLYTGSFQKPAPKFGFADAYLNHLYLLEVLMDCELPSKLQNAQYLAEVYDFLLSFPGLGEFSTYQLLLNISYTNVLNFSNMDFVVAGPGASSGLAKMFGTENMRRAKQSIPSIEEDIIRWLAENQNFQFDRLGIEFSGLGPDKLPMDLADIEHTLCEVDKYSRKAHPRFNGRRSELRSVFTPSPGVYPPKPVLPKAWGHETRRVLRIWPGAKPRKDPRYIVSCIKSHRNGPRGKEYRISWVGYTSEDDTWEPEDLLLQDAPTALHEYLASIE